MLLFIICLLIRVSKMFVSCKKREILTRIFSWKFVCDDILSNTIIRIHVSKVRNTRTWMNIMFSTIAFFVILFSLRSLRLICFDHMHLSNISLVLEVSNIFITVVFCDRLVHAITTHCITTTTK